MRRERERAHACARVRTRARSTYTFGVRSLHHTDTQARVRTTSGAGLVRACAGVHLARFAARGSLAIAFSSDARTPVGQATTA